MNEGRAVRINRGCRRTAAISIAAAVATFALPASGQGVGVSLRIGTLGYGGELSIPIDDRLGLRLLGNGLSTQRKVDGGSDIRFDAKLTLRSALLVGDWHPGGGRFRVSPGLQYNDSRFDLTYQPAGATVTINGVTYNAADIGALTGRVKVSRLNPYIGIGWGRAPTAAAGWFLSADLGAVYQRLTASLQVDCGAAVSASTCASLKSNVDAEATSVDSNLDPYRLYPVAMIGVGYRF